MPTKSLAPEVKPTLTSVHYLKFKIMDATRTPFPATLATKSLHSNRQDSQDMSREHAQQLSNLHTVGALKECLLTDAILVVRRRIRENIPYISDRSDCSQLSHHTHTLSLSSSATHPFFSLHATGSSQHTDTVDPVL